MAVINEERIVNPKSCTIFLKISERADHGEPRSSFQKISERDTRIELASLPWEGNVLPLYESRIRYYLRFKQ